jgi:hypothetical protein
MNIFYLHENPVTAARYHCDKHVVKMILEYAQLLSTAHHVLDGDDAPEGIYKVTHKNHPSAVWVRQSKDNYLWTFDLFVWLLKEYTARYNKDHKTSRLVSKLVQWPMNIPDTGFTQPPQCMPDEYKCDDPVTAYRNYYIGDKASFAVWKYSAPPMWYTGAENYARVY